MIIVEGPDGSGKTELIKRLGFERRSLKSVTGGVGGTTEQGWANGDPPLMAYVKKIITADTEEQAGLTKIAYDRFHLSEMVYGPILRGKQTLDEGMLRMLNDYLRGRHVPVILCLPTFETTLANVTREGRERPGYQTPEFLQQAYDEFTKTAPWATVVFDYEKDALPAIR